MLKHIVMWSLNDPADAPKVKALLDSCKGVVPSIREFEVGIKTDGLEANADVVLVSAFDDAQGLEDYVKHPHHQAVAQQIMPLRKTRHVVDYTA